MTIEYYHKDVYGNDLIYLVDSTASRCIHQLTGKKTLSQKDMNALSGLGINQVEVIAPRA